MHLSQNKQAYPTQIDVAGTQIKWVRVAKHLGNYIRSDMRDSDDIQHKRGDFIDQINNLIVKFGKCRHMVKQNIFNSQCSHLYGCDSWNHMDLCVNKFRKTWNSGVQRVFSLPYMTHTRFRNLLIERPYVTDQMLRWFYKMILSMEMTDSHIYHKE